MANRYWVGGSVVYPIVYDANADIRFSLTYFA